MSLAGLSAVVTTIYLCVVIGLGRGPTDADRRVLALSRSWPLRWRHSSTSPPATRSNVFANRLVYGDEHDPALDTFGSAGLHMCVLPMDELLLQLVELCKKHLKLRASEVWTGMDGQLTRSGHWYPISVRPRCRSGPRSFR